MTTYFEAYAERMKRTEELLISFAEELKKNGFSVFGYWRKDRVLKGIIIRKGGKHVRLYFYEVPYRWELGIMFKPNKQTGSGRTVLTSYDIEKIPFSINDIENYMWEDYPKQWSNNLLIEL